MPLARIAPRFAVLAALTAGLLGGTTGIASAAPTVPPGPASSPTTSDPTITYTMPTAHIRSTTSRSARARVRQRHSLEVRAVERVVHRQLGKPYVYGASGPGAFDCSGLVRYVYGHAVDRWLPHNAAAQYHSVMHVKRRNLEVGDLVFQGGNDPFHVGIYAGHGKWWHAPHSGAHVRLQKIYRGHLVYGRVLTSTFAKHHKH